MADAFVSSAYFEGGQLTLLEAVSANLPVIATRVGFAEHFEGLPGFEVLAPAVDLMRSADDSAEMESPADFIDRLGAAMVRVRESPRRPNFPREIREAMDTTYTYQKYADLVASLLKGERWDPSSCDADWVRMVEGLRGA
jgi:glycosyltransferase involved in cell wall biosynthesis